MDPRPCGQNVAVNGPLDGIESANDFCQVPAAYTTCSRLISGNSGMLITSAQAFSVWGRLPDLYPRYEYAFCR